MKMNEFGPKPTRNPVAFEPLAINVVGECLMDFYKADHRRQYPEGTEFVYSNWTPRASKYIPEVTEITLFGLQSSLSEILAWWDKSFFSRPLMDVVANYRRRMDGALGAGAIELSHVIALHKLGYLPIEVRAIKEGRAVPVGTPMFTIVNTKKEFFWITNYLETILSTQVWGMCVSASIAKRYRQVINQFAEETVGSTDFCRWQGHDFSCRGMFGIEAAMRSGSAHLAMFQGTDTVPALDYIEQFYDGLATFIGGSVAATEHSVMCMGTVDGEFDTFKRLITEVYPKGIVSIVSDTWDFWQVMTDFLPRLKDIIMNRDGRVVIRPDSGDPVKIVCGDPNAVPGSPEYKGMIEIMADIFGTTINKMGYKELPWQIGGIYGDSITLARCTAILTNLKAKGYATNCIVFGVGSFTYQYQTRDTFGFAMKATWGMVNGQERLIFKSPKTDDGTKKSLRGLILVNEVNGQFVHRDNVELSEYLAKVDSSAHELVLRDGVFYRKQTIAEIRELTGVWK